MNKIAQIEPSYDDLAFEPKREKSFFEITSELEQRFMVMDAITASVRKENDEKSYKKKFEQSEKMRDLQYEYAAKLEEKLRIATEALEFCSSTYPMCNLMIVEQALKKIKE